MGEARSHVQHLYNNLGSNVEVEVAVQAMPEAQGWLSLTTSANLVYKIFSSEVKDNGGRMQLKKYKKCYALV